MAGNHTKRHGCPGVVLTALLGSAAASPAVLAAQAASEVDPETMAVLLQQAARAYMKHGAEVTSVGGGALDGAYFRHGAELMGTDQGPAAAYFRQGAQVTGAAGSSWFSQGARATQVDQSVYFRRGAEASDVSESPYFRRGTTVSDVAQEPYFRQGARVGEALPYSPAIAPAGAYDLEEVVEPASETPGPQPGEARMGERSVVDGVNPDDPAATGGPPSAPPVDGAEPDYAEPDYDDAHPDGATTTEPPVSGPEPRQAGSGVGEPVAVDPQKPQDAPPRSARSTSPDALEGASKGR